MNAISRRSMLAGSGAFVLSFAMSPHLAALAADKKLPGSLSSDGRPGGGPGTPQLDAWIRIGADGKVTIFTGKVELGTGLLTALAQVSADELGVSMARISMVSGDTERTPDEGVSSSSRGMFDSGTALRYACADARQALLEMAAEKLRVPVEKLAVDDGTVTVASGPGHATYWELIGDREFARDATGTAPIRKPEERKYIGKSAARLDFPKKVFGAQSFVVDLRLPGMLHARVVRPQTNGLSAELVKFDDSAVRKMPGVVKVVRDGNFVAVLAEREEQAIWGAARLRDDITWKGGDILPDMKGLYDYIRAQPVQKSITKEHKGDAPAAMAKADLVIEATYTLPYQAHASVGPPCAVAQHRDGKLTIWSHTQQPYPLRYELSRILGMPMEAIHVSHMEGSGCYGDNGADDAAGDAAVLALAAEGRPVRVQYMREEMFAWEPKTSAMVIHMKGGLDAQGKVIAIESDFWTGTHSSRFRRVKEGSLMPYAWQRANSPLPGVWPMDISGAGSLSYAVANTRTVGHVINSPMRPGSLRSPGGFQFGFASEAFMDELAVAAGKDPLAFRLSHITSSRMRSTLEAVANLAQWRGGDSLGTSTGRGVAIKSSRGAYAAVVADVEVDRATGVIKVARVFAGGDVGNIVNPDGIIAQVEGCVMQCASRTLREEINFTREGTTTLDWTGYPILSFPETPEVKTVLIDRPTEGFGGVGELHAPCIPAAIANAAYYATGTRFRDIPLLPKRVKASIK